MADGHGGIKGSRVVWLGDRDRMVTTGVSCSTVQPQCFRSETELSDIVVVFENVGQANDALGYDKLDEHYDRDDRFELVRSA